MTIIYRNPIVVAVGLIPVWRNGRVEVCGVIRGKKGDDGLGQIALVSGYINEGESIEQGMSRETSEEIQLDTDPNGWWLMHSRHIPGKNLNLVFCCYGELFKTDILATSTPSEEVSGFMYINKETKLAFPTHAEAVQIYLTEPRYW
jgi:8-oxo-dGTP diphosphatase